MKKQYLISLLGLAAISIPLGSSISNASLQSISPAYNDSGLDTGIIINNEESKVTVSDEDYDGNNFIITTEGTTEINNKSNFKDGSLTGDEGYNKVAIDAQELESFTTIEKEPSGIIVNDILIDTTNNILEIKGKIDPKDSIIEEINIKKNVYESGELLEETKAVKTEVESWSLEDDGTLSFDIWNDEFIWEYSDIKSDSYIPQENSVKAYSLEAFYTMNGQSSENSLTYDLADSKFWEITRNNDLSYLKEDINNNDNKLGAGAVIAIIIAVLLLVGVIAFAGNILYKKYKIDKAAKKEENNQETTKAQNNDETLDNKDDQHNEEIDENVYS